MLHHDGDPLIVITGAAGFIGSGVVRHLNDQGYSNLALVDEAAPGVKEHNLFGKQWVDLIPKEELFGYLEGRESDIGAIIHLRCTDTLEQDKAYLLENNTRFSIRLAEYALRHGQRFIYASSAATYGDGSLGFSDDHQQLEALRPLNPYGDSKHLFDLWAKSQGVLDQIAGLKYFNVFGPNEDHKGRMASMIFKMFPIAREEGVVRLFKSSEPEKYAHGEQKRDFVYVKDAARITCDFLHNDLTGIFNLGRGEAVPWNRVAHALFKALNKTPNIQYIEMPEALVKQYQNYTCADMGKLFKEGKEQLFQYTLEEAVIDYVRNYLMKGEKW